MEGWVSEEKGISESQDLRNLSSGEGEQKGVGPGRSWQSACPNHLCSGEVGGADSGPQRPGQGAKGFSQIHKSSTLHLLSFQPSPGNSTVFVSKIVRFPFFPEAVDTIRAECPPPPRVHPHNPPLDKLVHGLCQQFSKNVQMGERNSDVGFSKCGFKNHLLPNQLW